jgi:hypothetical protein
MKATRAPADGTVSIHDLDRVAIETIHRLAQGQAVAYHGRDFGPIARAHRNLWRLKLVQIVASGHNTRLMLSEDGKRIAEELKPR